MRISTNSIWSTALLSVSYVCYQLWKAVTSGVCLKRILKALSGPCFYLQKPSSLNSVLLDRGQQQRSAYLKPADNRKVVDMLLLFRWHSMCVIVLRHDFCEVTQNRVILL